MVFGNVGMTHIAGLSLYVNARPRTERNHNNKNVASETSDWFRTPRHLSRRNAPSLPVDASTELSSYGRYRHIHGDAGLAGRLEHFLITNGPTRLDDGLDTGVDQNSAPSANGKNASDAATAPLVVVGSVSQRVGTLDGQIGGIHTIDLAHADAYGCLIVSDKYGVGFDATDGTPCEHRDLDGFSVGRLAGNQLPRVRIVA